MILFESMSEILATDTTGFVRNMLVGLVVLLIIKLLQTKQSDLSSIPTVGPSSLFQMCLTRRNYIFNLLELVQEGYEKYEIFKVAAPTHWVVVVNGPELLNEVARFGDDELSNRDASKSVLQSDYTVGIPNEHTLYLIHIIRTWLMRNLGTHFGLIHEEFEIIMEDMVPPGSSDWVSVDPQGFSRVICGLVNRVFVGLPLARDSDYLHLNHRHTIDIVKAGAVISLFPSFMRPIVGPIFSKLENNIQKGLKCLGPIINERRKLQASGNEMPDDFLAQLMNGDLGKTASERELTIMMLSMNFVAVHASAVTFLHSLYDLAARPEIVPSLREEVELIIGKEGWSKDAMFKMRKMDSFLRESQRTNGIGSLSMMRMTLKPVTFSNGMTIPRGAMVSAPAMPTHLDEKNYVDAKVFDAFRFVPDGEQKFDDIRGRRGDKSHLMVHTGPDFIQFGRGKHACPGRFFAATELKAMLAHIVLHYDIKFAEGNMRPPNQYFGTAIMPNRNAKLMFKERST